MSVRLAIRNNPKFIVFLTVLMSASLFFTVRVEQMRASVAKARIASALPSGTAVEVLDVVDGDELTVRAEGGKNFVIRILGVKSFDPVAYDRGISVFGRSCVAHLRQQVVGKKATLQFEEFRQDKSGRVLTYLEFEGQDVGRELLARGLTLVYVQYPSSREEDYLAVQKKARGDRVGLWGAEEASQRAQALLASWREQRQ